MYNRLDQEEQHEDDAQKDKYLTFALGDEEYGIEIAHVTEIIGIQSITEVPQLPEFMMGIINLRGKIIPVMDVRLRFRKRFRDYNDRTCIIVINIKELSIGLIVDRVAEVISIPRSDIVPPPDMKQEGSRYIQGIGKVGEQVKLLLDCDELLNYYEVESLHEAGQHNTGG
ncbi:chemotaxis protein CheW [Paenibacillus sp. GCM10012307]|uniref:Purine-binding chemotaxis protein CheW n=1 Tax=Paenibacillus roseus TaxID=2798579 RepID=A0A934J2K9_9BACL|nr:chemotaxis protein CheW [Paenibacillus roseus]MBJ6360303.1 purine-binding chemotaxis protein CheW [Paenibacillus roseus]